MEAICFSGSGYTIQRWYTQDPTEAITLLDRPIPDQAHSVEIWPGHDDSWVVSWKRSVGLMLWHYRNGVIQFAGGGQLPDPRTYRDIYEASLAILMEAP